MAVQIGTVRFKVLFLEDPLAVPWPVVDHLGRATGDQRSLPGQEVRRAAEDGV
ncbi:unnamed protein product [[Actinomadura] parvosata subsp. kistnae]|uniref:DUF4158 domain-containing protein n=1 Tax=[Actinomadura] parvosata TaxID=1955412 RepID=UPI000D2D039C|nr:DUF4158 domain-containing protein [Nonomuraea sp. ATCC 55076]SPL88611.1 unnamed protein product [Actinomadura parvosata subsp. kistnae]